MLLSTCPFCKVQYDADADPWHVWNCPKRPARSDEQIAKDFEAHKRRLYTYKYGE